MHAPPLTPRQLVGHQEAGALVVDVRTDLQFDDAHVPGAVCITALRGGFGSRLAWIADHDQPVVFVGRDDADALAAAELAQAVGDHERRRPPRGRDDELARGAPRRRRASSG